MPPPPKRAPKGVQRTPKGAQRAPKGGPKGALWVPKGHPRAHLGAQGHPRVPKWPKHCFLGQKWGVPRSIWKGNYRRNFTSPKNVHGHLSPPPLTKRVQIWPAVPPSDSPSIPNRGQYPTQTRISHTVYPLRGRWIYNVIYRERYWVH